jgi:predicted Zn-dependent peptidase
LIDGETQVGGTTCIVDPTAATEVAAVGVWFDRGSRSERPGEYGSTHFIEHLLFKGTTSRSAYAIAHEIDRLGGSINAFTEREHVCVHATVPAESFSLAAEILIDQTNESILDPAEVERERSVIENELEAADDDPEEFASDVFAETLWPEHPLGRRIGGTAAEVGSLSRDALVEAYGRYFKRRVPLVTAAGDIDLGTVSSRFSGAFGFSVDASVKNAEPPLTTGAHYRAAPFQHTQLFCSFQLQRKLSHDEYHALQIANSSIGDSMGSRLFQALREKRGLCYSVYSAPSLLSDTAVWTVYASSKTETAPELLGALAGELEALLRSGLSSQEIDDARAQLRGGMKLDALDVEYRMRRIARQALYGYAPLAVADASSRIAAMDESLVDRTFRTISDPRSAFILGVGPARGRAKFEAAAEAALDRIRKCV